MKSQDRQMQILELLQKVGSISTNELLDLLPASPATIRRDLVALEKTGKIRKAYGKILIEDVWRIPNYVVRHSENSEEKKRVGRKAAELVEEGDSIIIDAGSTLLHLAESLRDRHYLSVVTNSIPVACALNGTLINVFLCGGMLSDFALIDDDAVNFIAAHRVKKAFIGASGIHETDGLTVVSPFQCKLKQQMIRSAQEVYALLDGSKFRSMGVNVFAAYHELTGIITSHPITDERLLEQLARENVKVIYAE